MKDKYICGKNQNPMQSIGSLITHRIQRQYVLLPPLSSFLMWGVTFIVSLSS